MDIARLEPVDLRQLWKHEELEFTPWLTNHLELLGEAIGMALREVERETPVGPFSADITARTESGDLVLVENQLGPTDHDHLGKLLTYLSNLEAKVAIWIVAEARPEHVRAVEWLNDSTPDDVKVFLVRLAGYRIGASPPAVQFTVVAGPSPAGKAAGALRQQWARRHQLRYRFWEQLLASARAQGLTTHANISPTTNSILYAGAGRGGLYWAYVIRLRGASGVELYIATPDADTNKRYFDQLVAHREAIEQAFGGSLVWDRGEGKLSSHVRAEVPNAGIEEHEDHWPQIQDGMIQAMRRLTHAVGPYLKRLSLHRLEGGQ
jgi:hypothetical protein